MTSYCRGGTSVGSTAGPRQRNEYSRSSVGLWRQRPIVFDNGASTTAVKKVFAELGRHLSMSLPVCIERQGYHDIPVRHTVLVVNCTNFL